MSLPVALSGYIFDCRQCLHLIYPTNSMERIPSSGSNSLSASPDILRLLLNRVYRSPLDLKLSHMNPIHVFRTSFPKIHLFLVISCDLWYLVCVLNIFHACYMPRSSRQWFSHHNSIYWRMKLRKFIISRHFAGSNYFLAHVPKYSPKYTYTIILVIYNVGLFRVPSKFLIFTPVKQPLYTLDLKI